MLEELQWLGANMYNRCFMAIKTYVSSDIAGIYQDIQTVYQAYAPVAAYISGIELIALGNKKNIHKKISQAKDVGFAEVSLHGRTNSYGNTFLDRLESKIVDTQLLPTQDALEDFSPQYELLLHQPEVDKRGNLQKIEEASDIKQIWVENDHPGLQGVKPAVETVRLLRLKGIPSSLMLDLCHAIGVKDLLNGTFNTGWENLMQYIKSQLIQLVDKNSNPIWQGIHLPVGTVRDDSLPIDNPVRMPDSMLVTLSDLIHIGQIRRIVIENQQGVKVFGVSPHKLNALQKRNIFIFDRLQKSGIITKTTPEGFSPGAVFLNE